MKKGMTIEEVKEIFNEKSLEAFKLFMQGQTIMLDEGKSVYYYWDILKFLKNKEYRKI